MRLAIFLSVALLSATAFSQTTNPAASQPTTQPKDIAGTLPPFVVWAGEGYGTYHAEGCEQLTKTKSLTSLRRSVAEEKKLKPCGKCKPDKLQEEPASAQEIQVEADRKKRMEELEEDRREAHRQAVERAKPPTKMIGSAAISVTFADIGPVRILDKVRNEERETDSTYIYFIVRIANTTSDKLIVYKTWRGGVIDIETDDQKFASLRDLLGNSYRRIGTEFWWKWADSTDDATIYPGKSITDVLVFERPIDRKMEMKLSLPGENLGSPQQSISFTKLASP